MLKSYQMILNIVCTGKMNSVSFLHQHCKNCALTKRHADVENARTSAHLLHV